MSVFFCFQARAPLIPESTEVKRSDQKCSHPSSGQTRIDCFLCAKLVATAGDTSVSWTDTVLCSWSPGLWEEMTTQAIPNPV